MFYLSVICISILSETFNKDFIIYLLLLFGGPVGEGGGRGTHAGTDSEGVAPALRISWKKASFLRPPHDRDFVKEGYFFLDPGTKNGG